MSNRRILLVALCCAVVASAVVVLVNRGGRGPQLPALAHYGNLPGPFDRALQGARARAGSGAHGADGTRDLALLYQANRLYPEAKQCYRVLAAGAGGLSARDHYYLAAIAQDESDLPTAEGELRATLKAEPGYVPARVALADILYKTGRAASASAEYETVLGAEADQPQASLGIARIELQGGKDDEAVARLRKLLARHPESTSGAALLAQVLDRRGEAVEAAAMRARSQLSHEPAPPDPWMKELLVDCYDVRRLGVAFEQYWLTGQLDEALPLLGRLDELDPNGWIPPTLHGWSQKQAGNYPEAERQYRIALANGGDPERICPLLAAAQMTEGKAGDAAAMLADYHARLPRSIPILLSYSEAAVRLKDTKLARGLLKEVLEAEPNLYMPNMSMVQILWSAGEHDDAAQCLLRVARVYPADVDSRGMLGQYYLEKTDPQSAIRPLEEALANAQAQDPRRDRLTKMLDTAYLLAGSLAAADGHFAQAAAFSDKSIGLVPGGLRGYALKVNVCKRTGDLKGAMDALERMAALEPNDPAIRLGLGDIVYQEGDREKAREYWLQALQLAPSDAAELRTAARLRLSGQVSAETFR